MKRYHTKKDGSVAVCSAKVGNCPLEESDDHIEASSIIEANYRNSERLKALYENSFSSYLESKKFWEDPEWDSLDLFEKFKKASNIDNLVKNTLNADNTDSRRILSVLEQDIKVALKESADQDFIKKALENPDVINSYLLANNENVSFEDMAKALDNTAYSDIYEDYNIKTLRIDKDRYDKYFAQKSEEIAKDPNSKPDYSKPFYSIAYMRNLDDEALASYIKDGLKTDYYDDFARSIIKYGDGREMDSFTSSMSYEDFNDPSLEPVLFAESLKNDKLAKTFFENTRSPYYQGELFDKDPVSRATYNMLANNKMLAPNVRLKLMTYAKRGLPNDYDFLLEAMAERTDLSQNEIASIATVSNEEALERLINNPHLKADDIKLVYRARVKPTKDVKRMISERLKNLIGQ